MTIILVIFSGFDLQKQFLCEVCADKAEPDCLRDEATNSWNTGNMYCHKAAAWCDNWTYGADARHCCPVTCGVCEAVAMTCTCASGEPVVGSSCRGGEQCASCNDGFVGEQCVSEPVCTCANGTPAVYPDCNVDGEEKCSSCNGGWVGDRCDEVI